MSQQETGCLCPSSTCHDGAVVIGLLGPDGRLGYLRPAVPVDAALQHRLRADGDPETRLRFADRCVQGGCAHWSGARCGLIGQLRGSAQAPSDEGGPLPQCAIRATCQWFVQEGRAACVVCPLVVYRPGAAPGQK